jgi:hypothetical protein
MFGCLRQISESTNIERHVEYGQFTMFRLTSGCCPKFMSMKEAGFHGICILIFQQECTLIFSYCRSLAAKHR